MSANAEAHVKYGRSCLNARVRCFPKGSRFGNLPMASFGQTDREGRHSITRSRAALGRDCGFPLADRHCNVPLDRRELQRHGNLILVTVERQKVTFLSRT
jgi:hypothetical protein